MKWMGFNLTLFQTDVLNINFSMTFMQFKIGYGDLAL